MESGMTKRARHQKPATRDGENKNTKRGASTRSAPDRPAETLDVRHALANPPSQTGMNGFDDVLTTREAGDVRSPSRRSRLENKTEENKTEGE